MEDSISPTMAPLDAFPPREWHQELPLSWSLGRFGRVSLFSAFPRSFKCQVNAGVLCDKESTRHLFWIFPRRMRCRCLHGHNPWRHSLGSFQSRQRMFRFVLLKPLCEMNWAFLPRLFFLLKRLRKKSWRVWSQTPKYRSMGPRYSPSFPPKGSDYPLLFCFLEWLCDFVFEFQASSRVSSLKSPLFSSSMESWTPSTLPLSFLEGLGSRFLNERLFSRLFRTNLSR